MKRLTEEELLQRAKRPSEDALRLHPFYRGKIQVLPKCAIRSFEDFAIWYTPGVAAPSREIHQDPEKVFEHTNKGNLVAVVSDGTRVLGLGDIGPEAAMPVMEGKALLFKYLGGVDAFPICVDTKGPEELIRVVLLLQPTFGGVNLEDIEQPKCFRVLDTLRREAHIPVWHDDQQGTAAVTLAALINALKVVGKAPDQVRVAMVGAGAANVCIARLLEKAGFDLGKVVMVDSRGTLHPGREDLKGRYPEKWELAQRTNASGIVGGIPEAM
ncbi:MAG: malate dehydrogenase, partial [Deltaproteobacteria bacterium]